MSRLRISIRSDGLAAEAAADAGPACTKDDVLAALTKAGVVHGIDETALAQFALRLADPAPHAAVTVACGKAAEPGVDGRVERLYPAGIAAGRQHADGHVDYHERDMLHPVATGHLLARIVAPTPAKAGCDVRGRRIEGKPGRPHAVRFGPGVQVDGDRVVGGRNGVLLEDGRQIDVVACYQHGGDVDLRSGNLHSEGSLAIRGDVHEGFAATAGGDVQISGAVQRGTVAAGGAVRIDAGVFDGGSIRAAGNIVCRQATSARLEAGLDIDILDQATHCQLRANDIRIVKGKGTAFGGELRARGTIMLKTVGTKSGADTVLAVADVTAESADLVRATNHDNKVERTAARARRDGPGPSGKSNRLAMKGADQAQQQKLNLLQRQRTLLQTATIEVADMAHAGVRIQFGSLTLPLSEPRSKVRFRWDAQQNKILEEPLP